MNGPIDLLVAGRPSEDVMFSGLNAWPELGRDVDADGFGVCAGTSFNTPATANRLGLRVGCIATIGDDRWSRIVREEWGSEGLPTDFLRVVGKAMPFVSVAMNLGGDRGFVTYCGAEGSDDEELTRFALSVIETTAARHFHAYAGEHPVELVRAARERGMTVSLDAWGGPWWEGPVPLVKLGSLGAIAVAEGELHEAPAEPAEILDATGAGDHLNAGFLRGWLADLPLVHSLALGAICGARAVEAFGGYRGCPYEGELGELAISRGITMPPVLGGTP